MPEPPKVPFFCTGVVSPSNGRNFVVTYAFRTSDGALGSIMSETFENGVFHCSTPQELEDTVVQSGQKIQKCDTIDVYNIERYSFAMHSSCCIVFGLMKV